MPRLDGVFVTRAALFLSLAANCFAAGYLFSLVFRGPHWRPPPPPRLSPVEEVVMALSPDGRRKAELALDEMRQIFIAQRREMDESRRRALALTVAEAFDAAALREAIRAVDRAGFELRQRMADIVLRLLQDLPIEDRRAAADVLFRLGPPPGPGGPPGPPRF